MKKVIVLFAIFLSLSILCAGYSSSTMALKEEIEYNSYNYVGSYSSSANSYGVNSISSNRVLENIIDINIDEKFGLTITGGLGYQKDIYEFNRFASIPSNVNGKALFGVLYSPIDGLNISLSGGVRTSYLLSKSNWISQVGGEASIGYTLDFGLKCYLASSYWYNTNYRSIILGVGLGYSFGGER